MSISISGDGTFTGVSTNYSFDKSVSVGGTVTYEDVTSVDSIGIITARQGVVIGTGVSIGNPANNELGLYTNSAERLRIDSSGNLGIGTDNPSRLLHLFDIDAPPLLIDRDQSGERYAVEMRQSDTTDGNAFRLAYQSDTTGTGAASDVNFASIEFAADTHDQATRAGSIRFRTSQGGVGNEIERVRINTSGKIGIGTTGSSDPNDTITLMQNDNIRWLSSVGNLRQAIRCTAVDGMDFYTGSDNLAARINIVANLNLGGGSAIAASSTSGDFSVDIGGLRQVVGSAWRQASLLVYYSGIDGDATDGVTQLCSVRLRGLNTWNNRAVTDIVGTATVTISNSSQTGCTLTFDVSNSNSGSVIMFLTGGSGTDSFPTLTINA